MTRARSSSVNATGGDVVVACCLAQQRAVAIDNPSGPRDALEFIETQMDYELSAIDGNVRRIYEAMQAPIPAQAEE
jgi:hypothetical protein